MTTSYDTRSKEYIFDHGWKLNQKTGMLTLTVDQYRKADSTFINIRDQTFRALQLPTEFGLCCILEGKHFLL